ncbi:transcriptional regulator, LysR family [Halopseudomonas xinjiangensis]|uniref:Transcriptional regulator, LysR family n=2 Tax=Halopseudomonas xinjiangensis TaxID=487184 RepID=A0A1H1PBK7_9GAMM|nr:transcriptional regulator, LysR family [Halopseudomonas xinjiangensis]
MPSMDSISLNLLRIYLAVVEAGGISNAQAILNKDASTISRALSKLEAQLNLVLCERGRQGFLLTREGEKVYQEALKLFSSLRGFQQKVAGLSANDSDSLHISLIDNIITDPQCPLQPALQALHQRYGDKVDLDIQVHAPADTEKQLLDRRTDLAVGIFESKHEHLTYHTLYQESDSLYCFHDSPLGRLIAQGAEDTAIYAALLTQDLIARKFLKHQDLESFAQDHRGQVSFASNLEAIVLSILSGRYVGFIPQHYARSWQRSGQLLAVLPERFAHHSRIELAYQQENVKARPILAHFRDLLLRS